MSAAPEQGTVAVRPMGAADLDAVVAVEDAAGGLSWSRAMFEAELAEPDRRVWVVAEDGSGEVVGYAGVILVADEAHVANVAVHPRRQRQGVATRLVAAALEEASRRGAVAATLEVRPSNGAARELYRRLGFAPVGTRRGYYPDSGEDAIIMWLHDLVAVRPGGEGGSC